MWTQRLTDAQQSRVVELYTQGVPVSQIAQMIGCHHSYPTLLARRRGIPTRRQRRNERYDTGAPAATPSE